MARTTKPLTNTEVKQAKSKDKVDGSGLQLRIKPNSSKPWLLDYMRPYTKKRTEARELLAQNIDPQEQRDERRELMK